MFFIFLLLWFVFNGKITLELFLVGSLISALLYWFVCRFMDYSIKKDIKNIKKIPGMVAYIFFLIVEVIKCNFRLAFYIWTSKYEVEPKLVTFKTGLKGDKYRTLLANSITITPGTITAMLEDDELVVHCIDTDTSKGLSNSDFEKRLKKLEDMGD